MKELDIKIMAVYDLTSRHTTQALSSKIKVAFLRDYDNSNIEHIISAIGIQNSEFASRIVLDYEHPDYIVFANGALASIEYLEKLKYYLYTCRDSIFIFLGEECTDPDLNVFDYAAVWNSDLKCGDRITRNIPYIYNSIDSVLHENDLTRRNAAKLLENITGFCSFIYSHASEPRDSFFQLLSQYKRVEAYGKRFNNTGTQSTRGAANWYALSIDLKKSCKFSISMENATYKGYTSEKLITSLMAHTVPIYWGDPEVSELINPKAFINCHDYDSFDEVIERVKEIDSNDDLWLDMVTQPWQTQEQQAKTLQIVKARYEFMHNILSQDIRTARRRPVGSWGNISRRYFTGYTGVMPPLYLRVLRKIWRRASNFLSENAKSAIKKFLHMD